VHADPGLAAATGWPVIFEHPDEGLGALARPTAGPRAFLCGGARQAPDAAVRLQTLADPGWQPHASVLLERDPGLPLPATGEMLPVDVHSEHPGELRLELQAPFPGILVLAESWSEGWMVRVDGEPAEALVADHALLGVALQAGQHTVEWSYDPPGLRTGLLLLGLGLAGLAMVAWVGRRASEDGVG